MKINFVPFQFISWIFNALACIVESQSGLTHEKYIPTCQFGNTRVSEAADDLHPFMVCCLMGISGDSHLQFVGQTTLVFDRSIIRFDRRVIIMIILQKKCENYFLECNPLCSSEP